jgi:hypothetical protein
METYQTHQLKRLGNRTLLLLKTHPRKSTMELRQQVKQAQEILFQATTVFPFILFPDTLTIDRVKVTITHRFFFASAEVTSIQIEDILNVAATTDPLFGTVKIWSHVFRDRTEDTKHMQMTFLSRSNALEAACLIQGYIIARHKKIDTSHTSKKELLGLLRQLGQEKTPGT